MLTVSLPDPLNAFVHQQVESGAYANAEEVVQASLRRFQRQYEEDAHKLTQLRSAIQVGLDQLDRGEGIKVADVRAFLDEIEAEIDAEAADRAA